MDESQQRIIFETLSQYGKIPIPEWEKACSLLKTRHVAKNEYIIRQGDKPDSMAFILSGIFRVFCNTEDGDEKTLSFRTQGQFLAAYSPFLENRNTWYSIQALESGFLAHLFLEDYNKLSRGHPCWEKIAKEYIVRLFIEKEDRERSFLTEDAKTRYLSFKANYPLLEQSIHQFYIASYLGISPVSLSRIRGELKKSSES
ncbi:MAG: Crp/Fnr family transcriptional regulator [Desulfatibacillum sp.]|nr:Crp/Fnr family transcriptional regulator [Desulfatibacillum sp.]